VRLTPVRLLALCAALPGLPAAAAEHVVCHVTCGGETQRVRAEAVTRPYAVAPLSIASYFLFRIVFEREPAKLAAVKIYTYGARDEGAVPIHVAEFPYPVAVRSRYGFAGIQRVYEPVRNGELQNWCETVRKKGA
jgi:hypothetical protein